MTSCTGGENETTAQEHRGVGRVGIETSQHHEAGHPDRKSRKPEKYTTGLRVATPTIGERRRKRRRDKMYVNKGIKL